MPNKDKESLSAQTANAAPLAKETTMNLQIKAEQLPDNHPGPRLCNLVMHVLDCGRKTEYQEHQVRFHT